MDRKHIKDLIRGMSDAELMRECQQVDASAKAFQGMAAKLKREVKKRKRDKHKVFD